MHFLSHVNSRWAEALLPLSPLQQAQLVWEDLQWGNGAQELFPEREGVLLSGSPAVMTSCPRPAPLTYRLEVLQHRDLETMHYWVWCSVTKRSGHLTALPHGSMRCSHHWWIPTMWSLTRIDSNPPICTQFVSCEQCLMVPCNAIYFTSHTQTQTRTYIYAYCLFIPLLAASFSFPCTKYIKHTHTHTRVYSLYI